MGLEIGQRVGEYEILTLLGAGGMPQVYSAASAMPPRLHFFEAKAGQKSAARVTKAPVPSPFSRGGTAGATSNPPAETSAPPPKESTIAKLEAVPSHPSQSPQPPTPPVRLRYSLDAGKTARILADPTPQGPANQEIAQAHERMIRLDAKAEANRTGILQIRGQQQAQGSDRKGDILTDLNPMNTYLGAADRALNQNDLQPLTTVGSRGKEMATFETFLGR